MRFLTVRELRGNSARVWKELPAQGEMVVTNNGRPVAVLTAVEEGNLERTLAFSRRARAAQALADLQRESVRKGTDRMSTEAIDAEISRARKARRKATA